MALPDPGINCEIWTIFENHAIYLTRHYFSVDYVSDVTDVLLKIYFALLKRSYYIYAYDNTDSSD